MGQMQSKIHAVMEFLGSTVREAGCSAKNAPGEVKLHLLICFNVYMLFLLITIHVLILDFLNLFFSLFYFFNFEVISFFNFKYT